LRKQLCRPADATPGDLRDLARSHGYLGDLLLRLNRLSEADLAYWESQRLRLRLARDADAPTRTASSSPGATATWPPTTAEPVRPPRRRSSWSRRWRSAAS
jgi:hypothetical protein